MMIKDYRRLIMQSYISMIEVLLECPRQDFFSIQLIYTVLKKSKLNKLTTDKWRSDRGINVIYIIRYTQILFTIFSKRN